MWTVSEKTTLESHIRLILTRKWLIKTIHGLLKNGVDNGAITAKTYTVNQSSLDSLYDLYGKPRIDLHIL